MPPSPICLTHCAVCAEAEAENASASSSAVGRTFRRLNCVLNLSNRLKQRAETKKEIIGLIWVASLLGQSTFSGNCRKVTPSLLSSRQARRRKDKFYDAKVAQSLPF